MWVSAARASFGWRLRRRGREPRVPLELREMEGREKWWKLGWRRRREGAEWVRMRWWAMVELEEAMVIR